MAKTDSRVRLPAKASTTFVVLAFALSLVCSIVFAFAFAFAFASAFDAILGALHAIAHSLMHLPAGVQEAGASGRCLG